MPHPLFSAAWRTDLLYTWDSRTATGVLDLRPCRDRQIFSLSATSGEKTPDGEYALVTGRSCMYILRLRTLETRRVELPEGTASAEFSFDTPLNARFARGIDWHEANRICSSAGMFRLTWE
ncbi:MAG: hypothetical protein IJK04_00225 [Kiritimatiellae bacterium]|nr:hypothetical protein [Kiritimatiellia bacterium]